MSKLLPILLAVTMLSQGAFAGTCAQPVFHLLPNEAAPCEGYLFSPEKEHELRLMNEDYKFIQQELDLRQKQVDKLQQSVTLLEDVTKKEQDKAELWRAKAEDSTKKYMESEDGRGRRDLIFLIGGVVLTCAAAWAVGQVAHK